MKPTSTQSIIISDTNILSSFAAGDSLALLFHLFPRTKFYIPPAVFVELQAAIANGRIYLHSLLEAVTAQQISVLPLTADEAHLLEALPHRLNAGEREAIILAQERKGILLSNDRRATRYCEYQGIRALDLVDLLRLLWTRQIVTRREVRQLIVRMQQVENLTLTEEQEAIIFGANRRNS